MAPRLPGPIRRVGFLGNMNYPPNVMSLKKFLADYSARIDSLGLELIVAGYGSEVVRTWGTNTTVLGSIDDVVEFYSMVDAVVVPIDHGGGIKVKAVEAMVHGVPVFGTEHVRSGFDTSFRGYVGDIDDLMSGNRITTTAAPPGVVREAFSEVQFQNGVNDLLARSGF
ncbi:glycosyltransferase family 4 protein [Arthrobacter sp. efr-133-TYG-118]|uniref:glycosyltransferase family 4 protein n=1 Tax=Arthrobacter sp. efr-133-TYG-118 TaxID=3040279 RepID=UPI0025512C17|nr:glycosyltransferase family 4 protein [Arthrobacter sp. efr-133-TYG-118]